MRKTKRRKLEANSKGECIDIIVSKSNEFMVKFMLESDC